MCACASVSQLLLDNSASLMFQVLMRMQMDAEFIKEQTGAPFCVVGTLEGGFWGWGWVVSQGCPPKK